LTWINVRPAGLSFYEFGLALFARLNATGVTMTFAVAAGYGIAICITTAALICLSLVPRLPVVARSSAVVCSKASRSVRTGLLDRKYIR
jgi:hypothetical protein